MTDIEESRLSQLIRQKIVESYQDIRQMVGTEHIYVFAIGYSHFHGVGSFMCAANTIENLTDSLLQEPDDISPELVWSVVEWPYNSAPPSNELNELVNNLMADCEGNINESAEYLLLKEQIERCLIQSLLDLKKEFFFQLDSNKLSPILFVQEIECFNEELFFQSLSLLNDLSEYQPFWKKTNKEVLMYIAQTNINM